ncbi:MAG: thioredoxin [Patescibacteria group bacterium]
MSVKHIVGSEFNSAVLQSSKPTLVDFYAEWCVPCKRISSVLEELSQTHSNVEFVKVDVDAESELASNYNVSSIPTLMFFKNGEPVNQVIGAVSKTDVEKLISS